MTISVHKYEGAGNDFILIDGRDAIFEPDPQLIARLCDRRFGIGADGVMILEPSHSSLFKMRYFNSDGPEGTMCGNGGRCIALFAHHLGLGDQTKLFDAVDGMHRAQIVEAAAGSGTVELGMTDVESIESVMGGYLLDTGSPHYVTFVDDPAQIDVCGRGRTLRYSAELNRRGGANINFVGRIGTGRFALRTYERGVENETLACGTGATASAIVVNNRLQPDVCSFEIEVEGGALRVEFERTGEEYRNIRLTGPARHVFDAEVDIDNF